MGIVDKTNVMAEGLSVGGSEETTTETIDLGSSPAARVAAAQGQYLVVEVVTAFTADGGDPATHGTFHLESDTVNDLSSSPTVHWRSPAIAIATLVAGYRVCSLPLPAKADYKRFIGMRIISSGGTPGLFGDGTLTAYLSADPMLKTTYPDAI